MKPAALLISIFLTLHLSISAQTLNLMTYNIRYDNPSDPYPFGQRKNIIADQIHFHSVDIVGFQEALLHQNVQLQELLPDFTWIGVGRDDGNSTGEFCSIFYRKDRFLLVQQGTFTLSETPYQFGQKSWDAALHRICTWVELYDKDAFESFFVFNTHFDHQGQTAREQSAVLLLDTIPEITHAKPFFLLGDFNCDSTSTAYQSLKNKFADARQSASNHFGSGGTFNNWQLRQDFGIIDHIFHSPDWIIDWHAILNEHPGGIFPSDHYPVFIRAKREF
jgi:endonuclease/exonuclease/phosphatase family metal-dependent hydrolase